MQALSKIFGGEGKLKLMRVFLFNPQGEFVAADAAARADLTPAKAKGVLAELLSAGLIRRRKSKKDVLYSLEPKFPHQAALGELLLAVSVRADDRLAKRFAPVGKVRLLVASGIFSRQADARLDLLLVGDDISDARLGRIVKSVEAEIGKDILYSALSSADFQYRLGMQDRLLRDVFDFPHVVLVDKIGFEASK